MVTQRMEKMIAYQRFLFRHKSVVTSLIVIISAFFVFHLSQISVESRTGMWFNDDDPHYRRYCDFKEEFGNDHILVIGIRMPGHISDERADSVRRLSGRLRSLEGVRSVTSIFDFDDLQLRGLLVSEILQDFFMSTDRRATQILVHVSEEGSQFLRGDIISEVRKIVETERPRDATIYLSGSLFMGAELDRYARENAGKAILYTLIAISLILLLLYGKISVMISIILTSLLAVIWAMGFYAAMGNALNLMTNMITPLVLILSIAVGVHIVYRAKDEFRNFRSWKEAIIAGVSRVWMPCFLTSLTTSIGFFSLYFSPSKAISQFGLYASAAMLLEFFVFFHIFPLILHAFYRPKAADKKDRGNRFANLIARCARLSVHNNKVIILVFLFSTAILAVGVFRIEVDTNQLKYVGPQNEIVRSARFFDEFFAGIYPIQAVIVSSRKNVFLDRKALQQIRIFQERGAEECGLSKEISLADVFLSLDDRTNPKALLAFFPLKNADRFLERLVDEDFRRTVVSFRAPSGISSKEMMTIQAGLANIAGRIFDESEFRVELTGIMPLYAHFHEYIIKTQIISFSVAFVVIVLGIGVAFRSILLLFAVVFSNMTSIVMIFGLMGFVGINLDAGTVMVASCALGIIVDDTIHILFRLGSDLERTGNDFGVAIRRTIESKGKALIATSLTVGVGFLVLLANDFKPAKFFGILMAFTMFSALLADMLLLPSLIYRFRIKINRMKGGES